MLHPKLLAFISYDPDNPTTAQVEKLFRTCWIKAFVEHRCLRAPVSDPTLHLPHALRCGIVLNIQQSG